MYFKRKNKGFTLIELLMTVALLSVISVISFVSINAIILKNRDNQCKNTADSIKMAAKDFFSHNRLTLLQSPSATDLTENISTTIKITAKYDATTGVYTITAASLSTGNYLSGTITNPYDSSTTVDLESIKVKVTLDTDKTVKNVKIYYNNKENNLFDHENCG